MMGSVVNVCWFDWGLTPLLTLFQSVLLVEKPEEAKKTTNLGQVTEKPDHVRCELNSTRFRMIQRQARTHAV